MGELRRSYSLSWYLSVVLCIKTVSFTSAYHETIKASFLVMTLSSKRRNASLPRILSLPYPNPSMFETLPSVVERH